MRNVALIAAFSLFTMIAAQAAQQPGTPGQVQVQQAGENPIYKITINVVQRTAKAINYRHRSAATPIDFRGTPLMPEARGSANVESKQGRIEINSDFDKLQPATRYGNEYLTYVMWAITPEGRATNLGEILLNGDKSKLNVTTELQAFGLIVTAEPYFAVTQPSDVVVMENFVRHDTVGKVEEIDAKYELLQRGQYAINVPPSELKPMLLQKDTPLELYEARNAVRIARWMGADKDAPDSFQKADQLLMQAETYRNRKAGEKPVAMTAREAAQTAEDARLVALKRQEERSIAEQKAAADAREAQAKAAADEAQHQRQLEAERRVQAEAESKAAQVQTERTQFEAQVAAERAAREKAAAESDANQARMAAQKAEREKQELRMNLVRQLNLILETRDTARGLVVNMSDVLFDTGQYTLKPGAREKLARISGIILAYPGLTLAVEGHTDSVGGDDFNMQLSEKRATSVRDFLVQQGVNGSTISCRGMGKSDPVATNDTAAGRQQNRRVELIVAGEVIGAAIKGGGSR